MTTFLTRLVPVVVALVVGGPSVTAAQTPRLRVGAEVQAPLKLKHVDPVYPEAERAAGREGAVIMDITIGTEGSVTDAKILGQTTSPFTEPALAAVRQWRYTPTQLNGQAVEVVMTVTVSFRLGSEPSQARVRGGGIVPEPKLIKRVEPVYPPDALAAKVSGVVILDVAIGKDGSVVDAKVLRPVPMFEDAALAAVRRWKYTPTLLNGEPIEVLVVVTIHFSVK